jgi:hypothetical protein
VFTEMTFEVRRQELVEHLTTRAGFHAGKASCLEEKSGELRALVERAVAGESITLDAFEDLLEKLKLGQRGAFSQAIGMGGRGIAVVPLRVKGNDLGARIQEAAGKVVEQLAAAVEEHRAAERRASFYRDHQPNEASFRLTLTDLDRLGLVDQGRPRQMLLQDYAALSEGF